MIIAVSGFSGSGKSFLAKRLKEIFNCPYLSSDVIRKAIANIGYSQKVFDNFGEGLYSPPFTRKTYKEMLKRAKRLSDENEFVIVDATFLSFEQQQMLIDLNEDFLFIYCYADDSIIKERLENRLKDRNEVSDGRWEIYLKQKENFKGFIIPENRILKIDTTENGYIEKVVNFIKLSKNKS